MKINEIFQELNYNNFSFSYEPSKRQDNLFTKHHEKYDCIIQYEDRKPIEFNFQCNPKYDTPNLDMCLNSIILDAYCYRDNPNLIDFLKEFGYEFGYEEEDLLNVGNKAYEGCKKMYNTLSEVFTEKELNELYKFEYCYSQDEIEYEAEELER